MIKQFKKKFDLFFDKILIISQKRVIKHTFIYVISVILGKAVNIFLLPIYTRILSPSQYGKLDLIFVILSGLVLLASLQLESALARYFTSYKNIEERKKFNSTLIYIILFLGFFVSIFIVIAIYKNIIHISILEDVKYSLYIIILTLTPRIILDQFLYILRLEKNVKKFAIVNTLNLLCTALLSIVLVIGFKLGILGIVSAQFISTLAFAIITFILVRKYYGSSTK